LIQKSGEPPESHRPDWDRGLQLLVAQRGMSRRRSSSNCADYVPAICTHRPSLFPMDGEIQVVGLASCREDNRYLIIRGSKSRNKVAVGEPAAGSFFRCNPIPIKTEGSRQSARSNPRATKKAWPSHSHKIYFIFAARLRLSTAPTTCRDG
jgi:hypothetical protein